MRPSVKPLSSRGFARNALPTVSTAYAPMATVSGLAPLAFGGAVLQSAIVDLHLPPLGDLHVVTSMFFDVGVYLVVVGLLLDLLRSLGSGVDRHILRDEEAARAESGVTS